LIGVDFGVEMAHFGGREFSGEIGEGGAELRKFLERVAANDGNSVVRREVVEIVFESDEVKRVDEAVGGIAGDDIDLMIDESAIEEAEVHDVGLRGEVESVTSAPTAETVGALEEFVADTGAPLWGDGGEVGHGEEVEALRVVATDDHGESVFKAERLGENEVEALSVLIFDASVDGGGGIVGRRGFVEDGGESGAGVLDVEIEIAGEEGLVDKESAAEIGLANDRDAGASFDVLGEEFGENDLLGEKF